MSNKILFGFHAVTVRLKTAPKSVSEIHFDASRRDQRMRQFLERAREAGVRLIDSDDDRLQKFCGSSRHQGVAARVEAAAMSHSLDDTLDAVDGVPLLLVLDGITDPHNLGACLRVADGAGAHAVVGSARSARTTSKPDTTGIIRSRMISAVDPSRARARASAPP